MSHISNALTSAEKYKNIASKNIKEYIEYFAIGTFIIIFLVIISSISTNDPSGLVNKHFNVFIFFSSIGLFYLIINLLALALKKDQSADKMPIITIKHINVTLAVISILYIIFKLKLFHLNVTSMIVNIVLVACAVRY